MLRSNNKSYYVSVFVGFFFKSSRTPSAQSLFVIKVFSTVSPSLTNQTPERRFV